MKPLFNILLFIVFTVLLYWLSGVLTTLYYRKKNPLKFLPKDKTIYLTFDDGIDKKYTPQLLELLKKYNIKATFFVVSHFAKNNMNILQRMKAEGHIIGLHTHKHKNQILKSPFYIGKDFKESIAVLKSANIQPHYFRSPWGHLGLATLYFCKKAKLKIVLWNVIVQDWQRDTTAKIIRDKLFARAMDGGVICLHDGRGQNSAPAKTISALEDIIPFWISEGYTFETVDRLYQKDFA